MGFENSDLKVSINRELLGSLQKSFEDYKLATYQIVKDVYKPEDCSYVENNRVYPSGHVPGSYLGLSEQEKETLLKRFIEEKPDAFNESN